MREPPAADPALDYAKEFQRSSGYGHFGFLGIRPMAAGIGFRSQRVAEREGRSPSRAGARAHERVDRLKLQFQSREFVRNNGLYRGMLRRARSYIVGRGFKLVCKSSSARWNRQVEHLWTRWWRRPEVTQQLSGARLEQMVLDELLTCGETAIIPTDTGLLQHVEAEQIIGKNYLHQGIDRDELGRPTAFWVAPYDPNTGHRLVAKSRPYKPEAFFYVADMERPSANRATPPCQAAFPMLNRINDVCDSEAIAWQMQARVALISTREQGLAMAGVENVQDSGRAPGDATDGTASNSYVTELDYAMIFHGKPGETVSGMERTAPGGAFSETLSMFFRLLGLPLGLPLEIILLDWTHSNYSQSRAVLEQAFTTFLDWQDLLEDQFYRRVFEWWLQCMVDDGEIQARDDADEHDWIRPTFPWIDQLAEAQAQGEKVDRGFTTFGSVCKSLNSDREDVVADLKRETIDAIKAAQEVEAETGVAVPWQGFAGKKPEPAKAAAAPGDEKKAPAKDRNGKDQTDETNDKTDKKASKQLVSA